MEEVLKSLSEQFKKPHGELAIQVAEKMNEINETINLMSIDVLSPKSGDRILEIGMSNGIFVDRIFKIQPDLDYTGCDHSIKMIYEANRINEALIDTKKARFVHADAAYLPFDDAHFNKILVVATLYYFDDIERVFSQLHRVLQKDGQLIISIRPQSIMEGYGAASFANRMFTKEEFLDCVSSHHFKVLEVSEQQEPDFRIIDENYQSACVIIKAEKIS